MHTVWAWPFLVFLSTKISQGSNQKNFWTMGYPNVFLASSSETNLLNFYGPQGGWGLWFFCLYFPNIFCESFLPSSVWSLIGLPGKDHSTPVWMLRMAEKQVIASLKEQWILFNLPAKKTTTVFLEGCWGEPSNRPSLFWLSWCDRQGCHCIGSSSICYAFFSPKCTFGYWPSTLA